MDQVLLFNVGQEVYAMGITHLVEIGHARRIQPASTPTPGAVGEILSRGMRAPVVDLRRLFGTDAPPWTPDQPVVVMAPPRGPVGLLVDRVQEIQPPRGSVRTLPPRLLPETRNVYLGVLHRPDRLFLVLDEARVLQVASAQEGQS